MKKCGKTKGDGPPGMSIRKKRRQWVTKKIINGPKNGKNEKLPCGKIFHMCAQIMILTRNPHHAGTLPGPQEAVEALIRGEGL
jgi:hypothetical protein